MQTTLEAHVVIPKPFVHKCDTCANKEVKSKCLCKISLCPYCTNFNQYSPKDADD